MFSNSGNVPESRKSEIRGGEDAERIQGIRHARKRAGHGRRHHHRRGIRKDHHVAGGDIIMPPIGLLLGHVDFSSLFLNISGDTYPTLAAAKAANAATINYGIFLNTRDRFSDRRFRDFSDGAADQPLEHARAGGCAGHEGLPLLLFGDSAEGTRCPNCTSELRA